MWGTQKKNVRLESCIQLKGNALGGLSLLFLRQSPVEVTRT